MEEQKALYRIASTAFESNIGTNAFQEFLESKLVEQIDSENLQNLTVLLKSTVDYKIKTESFENMLYKTTLERAGDFTVKQIEIVVWALSKRMQSTHGSPMSEESKQMRAEAIRRLCDVLKLRSASMKARGVSFAVEAITNFCETDEYLTQEHAEEIFRRIERVVLSRIEEFIPHYLIKVLCSFTKAGQGSGELFDQIISKVLPAVRQVNSNEVYDMFSMD